MKRSLFAELQRRNVWRAGILYVGAVWALAQGIAQLAPLFGDYDWIARWFVIAGIIGFPFWVAFAWFYELTPQGLRRERDIAPGESITRQTGRKLDFAIIGVLAVAVVLLLTDRFVLHHGVNATASIPEKSIAVLPLVNNSGDKDQQYFSDGLSENLITALSQFHGLKVIGRNSAFQYRDSKLDSAAIGVKLGVAHLLEGSVQHAGDKVRISAELINAADGSTLWSQRYDRPYKDLFALQDEITQAVAAALKARLLPTEHATAQTDRPPSGNLAAYNAYLEGRFHFYRSTKEEMYRAIDQFTQATRLDPAYALAWAWLSQTWTALASQELEGVAAQQAFAKAGTAADRALGLNADLAEAHIARGYLLGQSHFDWLGAERESRLAVELAPGNGDAKFEFGRSLAILGQPRRAVELTRQALETDPLNARWYAWLGNYLNALHRPGDAEIAYQKVFELQPKGAAFHALFVITDVLRGNAQAALASAQAEPSQMWRDYALALALQIGPDKSAGDAALQTLIEKHSESSAYQIAEVYAVRNDADQTFAWLDRAKANGDPGISNLLADPLIGRFKSDPRFAAFCRKVGLPVPKPAAPDTPAVQDKKPGKASISGHA